MFNTWRFLIGMLCQILVLHLLLETIQSKDKISNAADDGFFFILIFFIKVILRVFNVLFGELLRRLRTKAGLTQEVLAFEAGLDRTYISLLELGKRTPSLNTIYLLSIGLKIPIDEFMGIIGKEIAMASRRR